MAIKIPIAKLQITNNKLQNLKIQSQLLESDISILSFIWNLTLIGGLV